MNTILLMHLYVSCVAWHERIQVRTQPRNSKYSEYLFCLLFYALAETSYISDCLTTYDIAENIHFERN